MNSVNRASVLKLFLWCFNILMFCSDTFSFFKCVFFYLTHQWQSPFYSLHLPPGLLSSECATQRTESVTTNTEKPSSLRILFMFMRHKSTTSDATLGKATDSLRKYWFKMWNMISLHGYMLIYLIQRIQVSSHFRREEIAIFFIFLKE